MIRRVSEKLTSGDTRHPTAADQSPVISTNSKMLSRWEPLFCPLIIATGSDLPKILLDLIMVRYGQTDGQTCAKYNIENEKKFLLNLLFNFSKDILRIFDRSYMGR